MIAAAVAEAIPTAEVVAVSPFPASIAYGKLLSAAVDWRLADPVAALDGSSEWDLIVGSPPIGRRLEVAQPAGEAAGLPPAAWRGEAAHLVIAAAAGHLATAGRLALLLGERSIFGRGGRLLEQWLAGRGVYLEASLSVLNGLPAASVDTQVSVFGHDRFEDLFVARVTQAAPSSEIVANLRSRNPGAAPELGMRVERERYQGWRPAMARLELEAILSESPNVSTLAEVSLAIERLRLLRGEPGPDFENAIYLPEVGAGPVRTRVDWNREGESRSVIAIRLDPKQVDAEYLTHWLNGPGKLFRQELARGTVPRVSLDGLGDLPVPLPPLELQIRNAEMRRQVAGLTTELDALSERITASFSSADLEGVEDELEKLLAGDDLDAWTNRLPFPVASVLLRCRAEVDPRRQLDHLLDFFEAFASCCATLLLSAARADQARWRSLRGKVSRCGDGGRIPFLRPTFGAWVNVGRTVVKALRPELAAGDEDVRGGILGVSDKGFSDALTSKELWDLLDRARAIRNRQSHGGSVSVGQMESRLRELRELLGELHQGFGRAFDRVQLIEPRESVYDRSVHRFPRARRLQGPNQVFMEGEVVSMEPLNHDSLYLVDRNRRLEATLELVPLLRLLPIPESDDSACFFIDRVEADGKFHFSSLHFTGGPVDPVVDPLLAELIAELRSANAETG